MDSGGRRLGAILWAVLLSVWMVSTVLAEGGKNQKRKNAAFTAAGWLTGTDSGPDFHTMTLAVDKAGSTLKRQLAEAPFAFTVSKEVTVQPDGAHPHVFDLTFDDLAVNDYVTVMGRKQTDGTYLVDHIRVFLEE